MVTGFRKAIINREYSSLQPSRSLKLSLIFEYNFEVVIPSLPIVNLLVVQRKLFGEVLSVFYRLTFTLIWKGICMHNIKLFVHLKFSTGFII